MLPAYLARSESPYARIAEHYADLNHTVFVAEKLEPLRSPEVIRNVFGAGRMTDAEVAKLYYYSGGLVATWVVHLLERLSEATSQQGRDVVLQLLWHSELLDYEPTGKFW